MQTLFGACVSILMFAQLINYSFTKLSVFLNREETNHQMFTEIDSLDGSRAFTRDATNFNFAIGVYQNSFGSFRGNIEEFLDVNVTLISSSGSQVGKDKVLGMHRCTQNDLKFFNAPLNEKKRAKMA